MVNLFAMDHKSDHTVWGCTPMTPNGSVTVLHAFNGDGASSSPPDQSSGASFYGNHGKPLGRGGSCSLGRSRLLLADAARDHRNCRDDIIRSTR